MESKLFSSSSGFSKQTAVFNLKANNNILIIYCICSLKLFKEKTAALLNSCCYGDIFNSTEDEAQALCMLGKCSVMELYPQSQEQLFNPSLPKVSWFIFLVPSKNKNAVISSLVVYRILTTDPGTFNYILHSSLEMFPI